MTTAGVTPSRFNGISPNEAFLGKTDLGYSEVQENALEKMRLQVQGEGLRSSKRSGTGSGKDDQTGVTFKPETMLCALPNLILEPERKALFKPESTLRAPDHTRNTEDVYRLGFQVSVTRLAAGFRPQTLEDTLCRLLTRNDGTIDCSSLGFDPSLRNKLSKALSAQPPALDKELLKSIEGGLKQGLFQDQLKDTLSKLVKGQLQPSETADLNKQLNASGLFDKSVFQAAVEKEKAANMWGPASQAAFVDTAKVAVEKANIHLSKLTEAQFKYFPVGWGLEIPADQTFEDFRKSGKAKVVLDFKENEPPSTKTYEKLQNICIANAQAFMQEQSASKLRSYETMRDWLKHIERESWIPNSQSKKIEAFDPQWERRLKEVAPWASLYDQVEGTRKKVEILNKLRMPGGGGGWKKEFADALGFTTESDTRFIDDALKALPKDKSGKTLMPTSLEAGPDGDQIRQKLQAFLDSHQSRIDEAFNKVLEHMMSKHLACYGNRPKLDTDPAGDYNLVRHRCEVTKMSQEEYNKLSDEEKKGCKPDDDYMVVIKTNYMKSDFIYDLDASKGRDAQGAELNEQDGLRRIVFSGKKGDLIPVIDIQKGSLALCELGPQLQTYMSSESSLDKMGTVFDIGMDAAMLICGARLVTAPLKMGAKAATEQAAKSFIKSVLTRLTSRTFISGSIDIALAVTGPYLNNAHARWEDKDLQLAGAWRGHIFGIKAGLHVLSATGKGIGYLRGADAATKAGEVAAVGEAAKVGEAAAKTPWSDLSTIGKFLRAGKTVAVNTPDAFMAASQFYYLPPLWREFNGYIDGKEQGNMEAALESLNVESPSLKQTLKQSVNTVGAKAFDTQVNATRVSTFLESSALTLSNGKNADVTATIDKTIEVASKLRQLPADSKEREPLSLQLADRFKNGGTPEEKLAACAGLIESARGADGKLAQTAGGIPVEQLLAHLRDDMSTANLDAGKTTPERAMVAAKTRMLVGDVDGRDFIHLCERFSRSADASNAVKMQAILGLGMAMWSAEKTESSFKTGPEELAYWQRSHGTSRSDLEVRLIDIANGVKPNTTLDQQAFAASVLHALNRENVNERLTLLGATIKDWSDNSDKPGGFTAAYIARMRKDMEFNPATDNANPVAGIGRQFMAASALSQLPAADKDPVLRKKIADTFASCISEKAPDMTIQALAALLPDRIKDTNVDRVAVSVFNLLLAPNTRDAAGGDKVAMKMVLMQALPDLLKGTKYGPQAVNALESLIRPTKPNAPDKPNPLYAAQFPELRMQAVETLARMGSLRSEQILRDMVEFKDGKPLEPSVTVRIAAYQALNHIVPVQNLQRNDQFKAFLSHQMEFEREPRAYAILAGLKEQRQERPVPLRGEFFDPEKKKQEFPAVKSKDKIDGYEKDCAAFLKDPKNCPGLDANKYRAELADATRDYDGPGGGAREIRDTYALQAAKGEWLAGRTFAREYYKKERERIISDHVGEFRKLEHRVNGHLEDGAPITKEAQIQAIHAAAYLIKNGGKVEDKEWFSSPVSDAADVAKWLVKLCAPQTDGAIRAEAKDALIELIQLKDLNPRVRLELVKGMNNLFDWGADEMTADKRSQATISKEEGSVLAGLVLSAVRAGTLPEDSARPDDPNARSAWREEVKASLSLQIKLMNSMVWCHQNREGVNLLEKVRSSTSNETLKKYAQLFIDRTYGVEVRNNFIADHPDLVKPPAQRAAEMQAALAKVTDAATAHEAVDVILRGVYGEPLTANDPRLAVLRSALNSDQDVVRLAAAYACLSPMSNNLRPEVFATIFWPSTQALADIANNSQDPHAKYEAGRKLQRAEDKLKANTNEGQIARLRELIQEYPNNDKYKTDLAALEKKSEPGQKVFKMFNAEKEKAKAMAAGFDTIVENVMKYPQQAPLETRTKWLENALAGTGDGDPVRSIFNALFELNPASQTAPPGTVSKWKTQLSQDDPRLPLLRKLAETTDMRVAAAANVMLGCLSTDQTDRDASLKRLNVLYEKGPEPLRKDLSVRLLDLHGQKAVSILRANKIQEAEEHIDKMLKFNHERYGDKLGQVCLRMVKTQCQLLKTIQDNAAAKRDNDTAARARALQRKLESVVDTAPAAAR